MSSSSLAALKLHPVRTEWPNRLLLVAWLVVLAGLSTAVVFRSADRHTARAATEILGDTIKWTFTYILHDMICPQTLQCDWHTHTTHRRLVTSYRHCRWWLVETAAVSNVNTRTIVRLQKCVPWMKRKLVSRLLHSAPRPLACGI